jgi:HK97 family phage prohead protease
MESFRAPKSVLNEVENNRSLAVAEKIESALSIDDILEIRSSWQGQNGQDWANRISSSVEERVAQLMKGSTIMNETRDDVYGENAYGIANSIMAADASIDAAQDLLESIMETNPTAAQAYYLLVAADASLDPVIEALGLVDPDEEAGESTDAPDEEDSTTTTNSMEMNSATPEVMEDELADRAAAARLGEGSFVSWSTSNGRARGKIEKVVTKGQAKSSEGFVIEATPDQPAYSVRIYKEQGNGYVPTDVVTVHRGDYLTITTALPAPRSEDLSMVEERKTMIAGAERITMTAEIRSVATDDGSIKVAGYAATFNNEATGLNFREVIAPGAFTRTLQTDNPIFLLINHDMEQLPLASTRSGTLQLSEDEIGLRMEATLDPLNPRAAELASALGRGDVDKMSFAFTVAPGGDTRAEGLRTLTDLDLYEISVVNLPAYDDTSVGLRNEQATENLNLRKRKLALKFKQYSLTK